MAISFIKNLKAKAEKIRKAVEEGSTTLRELREEVEGTVSDLKADNEEKIMDTLTEIQESTSVFEEAGYELIGLRIEMGFNPKVVPSIRRVEDISDRAFRKLIEKHEDRKVVSALLKAIRKAEQMEDKVNLSSLELCNFEIEVGVVPAIHINWAKPEEEAPAADTKTPAPEPAQETRSPFISSSSFTKSSFTSSFDIKDDTEEEPAPLPKQPEPATLSAPKAQPAQPTPSATELPASKPVVVQEEVKEDGKGLDRWIQFPEIK
ncbi:MAG: hypothetical protein CMO74_07060 [Verrucomicrobiales bacterium]|nr:hypothetical protein [Verrucomicrobiales bacterium]|tara:strand:- start:459 stop:1247 length:789 start_codon:yes stop_codon:yes gene_type:complete